MQLMTTILGAALCVLFVLPMQPGYCQDWADDWPFLRLEPSAGAPPLYQEPARPYNECDTLGDWLDSATDAYHACIDMLEEPASHSEDDVTVCQSTVAIYETYFDRWWNNC